MTASVAVRLVPLRDYAEEVGIPYSTAWAHAKAGKLPTLRAGGLWYVRVAAPPIGGEV